MASEIVRLAEIITENVNKIQRIADEAGIAHPSLNDPYDATTESEKLTITSDVLSAALVATSAASQLIATLKLPGLSLLDRSSAVSPEHSACRMLINTKFHVSSAMRICLESCVSEILREGGSEGVALSDIASKSGTDAGPLG
jgi:hypothetical protein